MSPINNRNPPASPLNANNISSNNPNNKSTIQGLGGMREMSPIEKPKDKSSSTPTKSGS